MPVLCSFAPYFYDSQYPRSSLIDVRVGQIYTYEKYMDSGCDAFVALVYNKNIETFDKNTIYIPSIYRLNVSQS